MQIQLCRDPERCFFGKAPALSLIREAYGRSSAESWLEIQLNNLSEFAGCKEKLRPKQISDLATMIYESYPHYKLTEFMLFFQRFKRCEYGKFYGAVDPMVILQALATFDEDRSRIHKERRHAEERENAAAAEREYQQLRQRYIDRIPDAFTDRAPLSFIQYRLMGYDTMPDDRLRNEIADLRSGAKSIPKDVVKIMDLLKSTFEINNNE